MRRSGRRPWLLALWLGVVLAGCGDGRKAEPLPRGAVVIVLGDSITAAHGLSPEQAWTSVLAAQTGWQVINAGLSGDTTGGGRARLPALLDEHRPAAVIVELGGNDMLRRLPASQTSANLEAMLAAIGAAGARPILMATPQPSIAGAVFANLSDAPFYADVAKRQGVPLIADVLADVLSKPDYKLDHLHPNAEGQRRVGEAAVKALRKLGLAGG